MNTDDDLKAALDHYTDLVRRTASMAARDRHYRMCTHDLEASEAAEESVGDLFSGAEREAAQELLGRVFFHITEIETLHARQMKRIRLKRDATFDAQVAEHQDAFRSLTDRMFALRR
ncbi:hypothetical protein [Glycomyces sp. YM15]|uniref:hypothetical protein n=1 Tax=Glycomyces sp. YM15 TaxID=2800446 RepID=UPI001962A8E6|nr:hypothetical protein [Glycomyces sp. YM15]